MKSIHEGSGRASVGSRFRIAALIVCVVACCVGVLGGCAQLGTPGSRLTRRFESPDVFGYTRSHRVRGDETLLDLTRRYDLGYVELLAANPGVDPWVPGVGRRILLPTAHLLPAGRREGIVINLAEQRLYLFDDATGKAKLSFPIGVSRQGFETPLGETEVVRKRVSPVWRPTAAARRDDPTLPAVVTAGPENPLGTHALYLGWPLYLIHGTNEPDGVGRAVSRGCIRLYPQDIIALFEATPVQTAVRVINDPVKLAWVGSDLFLEVHPSLDEMAEIEERGRLAPIKPQDLRPRIRAFIAGGPAGVGLDVDWGVAYQTAAERRGLPVRISR